MFKTKTTDRAPWLALGCGGLLVFACISANFVFRDISKSWDDQLATLIATDDSIVAFGDGAHAVPIHPDIVENIGETNIVFGLSITLDKAGPIKPVENVHGEWEYWFVEFTVKNMLDEIQYGINPGVESQLQYLSGDYYIWDLHDFEQSQCDNENLVNGLNPGESLHCRYIYIVPADDRNLYWVYTRNGKVEGAYEERYVVFQIR